jgi:hypothetical protein
MSTSSKRVAVEAAAVGIAAAGIAVLGSASDPWLGAGAAHPAWLGVLALSVYYGLRGLLISLPIVWSMTAVAAVCVGAGLDGALLRATGAIDIAALSASVVAAGIAMAHVRSQRQLTGELAGLRQQASFDTRLLEQLREHVLTLRARQNRVDHSISYWRDIAARLEGPSPKHAARAALELCLQRTGARAGIVRQLDGAALHNLAWRGRWSEQMPTPRDIFRDATMSYAIERDCAVFADEVEGAWERDADIAAPLRAPNGNIVGVLGLRGVSRSRLGAAELRDVMATASWLAEALVSSSRRPDTTSFSRASTANDQSG